MLAAADPEGDEAEELPHRLLAGEVGFDGRNVSALATNGRLVIIGFQGGTKGELDISALLRKRGSVTATSLRARPLAEKAKICCEVVENVWPLVAAGRVRPIVETTMPLEDVARAHQLMEDGGRAGKIVLTL